VTVYLLAHGSRDPRHAADVRGIASRLEARLGREVRASYLDHCGPTLAEVADAPGEVVPLLLCPGYHVQVDVGLAVAEAPVPLSVLAPPLLTSGAGWGRALLREVGRDWPGHRVVMVAAGTRDVAVLQAWAVTSRALGVPVAQASGPGPRLDSLRLAGPWVVLPLLVARGFFGDRIADEAAQVRLPVADAAGASDALTTELLRVLHEPHGQGPLRQGVPSAGGAARG
jgi:sirohydrochlorin ferrochelatase